MTNPEVRLAAATDGSVTAVWPQWITDPGQCDSHFEVQSATRSAAGTLVGTRDTSDDQRVAATAPPSSPPGRTGR